MDKQASTELASSVRDVDRHMRGGKVVGARVTKAREPNVPAIRRQSGSSQSRFAALIGVSLRTLQNREQGRTRPPARRAPCCGLLRKTPRPC